MPQGSNFIKIDNKLPIRNDDHNATIKHDKVAWDPKRDNNNKLNA